MKELSIGVGIVLLGVWMFTGISPLDILIGMYNLYILTINLIQSMF